MPTDNYIIIDKGTSLHPETNTHQVYDFNSKKWLNKIIEDLQEKPVTWNELQGKPTSFPPSPHTHTVSQITDFPEPYQLPVATISTLGGIKPDGTTITIDPNTGIASVSIGNISETWKTATMENGWTTGSASNNNQLMYYKDITGRVYIRGQGRKSSATLNKIFTLPEGYRPTLGNTYELYTYANNNSGEIVNVEIGINYDGSVSLTKPIISEVDRIYFDVSFRAV